MERLGIFAKYWESGKVKTRLADSIGPVAASDIYRAFLNHLLQRHTHSACQLTLAYSPPEKREAFARLGFDRWTLEPQCSGDLGVRMHHFFESSFDSTDARPEKVVLIGSDSPQLKVESLRQAFDALTMHDVTIGPCPDGGYYLIGMKGQAFDLFQDIDWGSEFVFEQTRSQVEEQRISLHVLEPLLDVDYLDDLHQLISDYERRAELDSLDETLLANIRTVLAGTSGESA